MTTGTDSAYQALMAAANTPKSSGCRPLCILPSIDGMPLFKDFSGPLWQPMSAIGGKRSPGILEALFGGSVSRGWPGQTAVAEFAQMSVGDVVAGNLVAPLTPMGGGGSGGGVEIS